MNVNWDDQGLAPAIVQDAVSGTVLMLGWMDKEALAETERTGSVHFHSRSRGRLWKKGETSGNVLRLVDVKVDCDGDALLVRAHPTGPVCHTGDATCWGNDPAPEIARVLSELVGVIGQRKQDLPEGSYTAKLFKGGRGAIAQKVGEEALELALAATTESHERALSEYTDLLYALLVLGVDLGLTPDELTRSLAEKKSAAAARGSPG